MDVRGRRRNGVRGWIRRHLAWAAFAPSLAAGLLGALLLAVRPFPYEPRMEPLPSLLVGLGAGVALLGSAALLERTSSSFRWASRATERVLARLRLSAPAAGALAVSTSVGEELLFRGVLLPAVGLVPQALLFGLLHPAGRKGWSYPLYAAAAAVLLGGVVLITGRLLPAIVAHLVVNATGLSGRPGRKGPRNGKRSNGARGIKGGTRPSDPPPP